ncbi:twin-arginine translocase TatA/TatE family subunit [Phycicoccus sp. HDW14]|uniref:Sec-independent protein translocase subunit TatA n=1 Tax=Phycicoccus sp. HDW14 TaxID=2714941 RepID=UPI00140D2B58|nr:Sec-independent protein translocase subunit TatA [Phycicoccus sp. HDW14]QIM20862.1 twin-arginine translocase TatA/TatE family subunit [Phycicoccus sp. HDW14]
MLRNFGAPEIIIIAVLVILIFGWKKLPDAARSLGRSARVFKSEVDEMKKDGKASASPAASETVRGEPVTTARPVDDVVLPDPDGNAVHEKTPRTDNQSGPVL